MAYNARKFIVLGLAAIGALSACDNVSSTVSSSSESEAPSSSADPIDKNQFPLYDENYLTRDYSFTDNERDYPFYWGNIIHNESALMIENADGSISASLAFPALKVISVRDYVYETEYVEGEDYVIEGNKLIRTENSRINYWTEAQLVGENIPAPYVKVEGMIRNIQTDYMLMGATIYTESPFFYSNQIMVTYAYDVKELDLTEYPTFMGDELINFYPKLKARQDVKITVIGDSVSEGCSSSGKFEHPLYAGICRFARRSLGTAIFLERHDR